MSTKDEISPEEAARILKEHGFSFEEEKAAPSERETSFIEGMTIPKVAEFSNYPYLGKKLSQAAVGGLDVIGLPMQLGEFLTKKAGQKLLKLPAQNEPEGIVTLPSEAVGKLYEKGYKKISGEAIPEATVKEKLTVAPLEFIGGGQALKTAVKAKKALFNKFGKQAPEGLVEKIVPQSGKDYAQLGLAGAGSKAGEELFKEDPLLSAGASIVGASLGTAPLNLYERLKQVKNLPPSKAAEMIGFVPQRYKEFKEAEITPKLSELSSSKPLKSISTMAAKMPGAGAVYEKALEKRVGELDVVRKKNLPEKFVETPEGRHEIITKGAESYSKAAKAKRDELYKLFRDTVPEDALIDPPKAAAFMESYFGKYPNLAREVANSETGREFIAFLDKLKTQKEKDLKGLTIPELLDFYKSKWDQRVKTPHALSGTVDEGAFKKASSLLKEDVKDYIISTNPASKEKLDKADAYWKNYKKNTEFYLKRLLRNDDPSTSFNTLYNSLKANKLDNFYRVTNQLDKSDKKILRTTFLDEMGQKNGEFNWLELEKKYSNLRPKAQNALLQGMNLSEKIKFKSIMNSIKNIKGEMAEANNPHSGEAAAKFFLVWEMFSNPGKVLGTLGGYYGFARLNHNKEFMDKLYQVSKSKSGQEALEKTVPYFTKLKRNFEDSAKQSYLVSQKAPSIVQEQDKKEDISPDEAAEILKSYGIE